MEEEEILSKIAKNLKEFRDIKTNIEEFNKQLQGYKDEINTKALDPTYSEYEVDLLSYIYADSSEVPF